MNKIKLPQSSVKKIIENSMQQLKKEVENHKEKEDEAFEILEKHIKAVNEALKLAKNMQVMINHISQKQLDKLVDILSFNEEYSAYSYSQVFRKRNRKAYKGNI